MIELKQVTFQYDKKEILHNLDLKIKEGKITTILGPNGSGKSTLLHVMARLNKPTSGEILLENESISKMKSKDFAKKLAIVNQKNSAPYDQDVETIVSYGRLPYAKLGYALTKTDYEIIEWAMKVTGLESIAKEKMGSLSGGQAQRVWIAMALAQKTKILLLDEPTTYLDIKYQYEILELVKQLNKNLGLTIILVLHDLNQAIDYSDELIGLKSGNILFQTSKENVNSDLIQELYDYPLEIINYQNQKLVMKGQNNEKK